MPVVKQQGVNATDWTHYQYDALGLLVAGWAPAQWGNAATPSLATNKPTALYAYNIYASGPTIRSTPTAVTSAQFVTLDNGSYEGEAGAEQVRRSYTFLDGWGRTLEQHSPAPNGTTGRTIVATHYNALGQTDWTSTPFYDALSATLVSGLKNPTLGSLPSVTQTLFDVLGRPTSQSLLSDGSVVSTSGVAATTTTSYAGAQTTVTSPVGDATQSTVDLLGRVIKQQQGQLVGAVFTPQVTTDYAYVTLATTGQEGFAQVTVTDTVDAR